MNKININKVRISIKKLIDGEPHNINPLKEIPDPFMRLYGTYGNYFDTFEEAINYCKKNNISTDKIHILDYLGNVAERNDVIRKTYMNGNFILYTAVDEDGYGIYNYERSIYNGKFIWEYVHGNIKEMYIPFRDRGIIFKNDIYDKIEETDKRILKMVKKKNLFNNN